MHRSQIALLVLTAALGLRAAAPSPAATAALAKQWKDLRLYDDVNLKTGQKNGKQVSGMLLCLRALDSYTKEGVPANKDQEARSELRIWADQNSPGVYDLLTPDALLSALASTSPLGKVEDSAVIEVLAAAADSEIKNLPSSQLAEIKNQIQAGSNPAAFNFRALYLLLKTQEPAVADYDNKRANASSAREKAVKSQEDAKNGAQSAKAKADASRAAEQEAKDAEDAYAKDALHQAELTLPTVQSALKKDEADIKKATTDAERDAATQKQRQHKDQFDAAQRVLKHATSDERNASQALKDKAALLRSHADQLKQDAGQAASQAGQAQKTADGDAKAFASAVTDESNAQKSAESARDVMDKYRICYAADNGASLLKIVAKY